MVRSGQADGRECEHLLCITLWMVIRVSTAPQLIVYCRTLALTHI